MMPQVRSATDDLSRLHPDEFIGSAFEQRGLVRDDKDRFAHIAQASEQAHHLSGRTHVHVGEGLVKQKNLGIV